MRKKERGVERKGKGVREKGRYCSVCGGDEKASEKNLRRWIWGRILERVNEEEWVEW